MKLNKSEAGKLGALASKETIKQNVHNRKLVYYEHPKKCLNCHEVIKYEKQVNKFCSKNCSATFNNKNNHWRGPNKPLPVCKYCGSNILHEGKIYCSTKCHNDEKRDKLFSDYKNGLASSRVARNIMIELYGNKCMECGWSKINSISKKCPIELEHSDGNSKNNIPSNLKLLCPNCHSLTPTYKALNKGNGRHSRMTRYHNGKSF